MIIDYCSDLHVDHYKNDIDWRSLKTIGSSVLIVAGDCSNDPQKTNDVLTSAKQHYEAVCYVDGNHDSYNTGLNNKRTVESTKRQLHFYSMKHNWNFLPYGNTIVGNNIAIIGNCGWYDWNYEGASFLSQHNTWKTYMNDSRVIDFKDDKGDIKLPDVLAKSCFADLTKRISLLDNNENIDHIVVVTHTIPHKKFLTIKNDPIWNSLSGSFLNSYMENIGKYSKKIKHIVFGHTHYTFEDEINGINYHCNPLGYPHENKTLNLKQFELIHKV